MKKSARAKLLCKKELPSGQIDMFEVIILITDKQEKKKYFEDMGYEVTVK